MTTTEHCACPGGRHREHCPDNDRASLATITFTVPNPLPLSANQRLHWAPKAQRTHTLRRIGYYAARATKHAPFDHRVHLVVHLGWPDRRRRDAHNAMPTVKALIDGVVDAKTHLTDDSDDHLTGPDLRSHCAGRKGVVVITFDFQETHP